jgi:hypothetical protein
VARGETYRITTEAMKGTEKVEDALSQREETERRQGQSMDSLFQKRRMTGPSEEGASHDFTELGTGLVPGAGSLGTEFPNLIQRAVPG